MSVITVPSGVVGELLDRVAAEDPAGFERWLGRAGRVGFCSNPVRLVGQAAEADRATGELRTVYDAASEDDGVLLVACGDRRVSVCPACAEVYRRDAWQLINAGLRGGKGVPASVGAHPLVFATFTAPSFGAVHTRVEKGNRVEVCTRRDVRHRCGHGRPVGCWARHAADDPRIGAPICGDCYDVRGAVVWNALAPRLWARTVTYVMRALARQAGMSQRACKALVRLRYVKVAEFQRRGLVHFHALIRLDGAPPAQDPGRLLPPPPGFTVEVLKAAVVAGAAVVGVPVPVAADHVGPVPVVRWGAEVDVRAVAARVGGRGRRRHALSVVGQGPDAGGDAGEGLGEVDATTNVGEGLGEVAERDANGAGEDAGNAGDEWEDRVAGYLAKYTTKAAEALGLPNRRLRAGDLARLGGLGLPAHVVALVQAAWELGGLPHLAPLGLRRWAHMLGFGGHFATKSRRYSVTFGALRRERVSWQRARASGGTVPLDAWGRPEDDGATVRVGWWTYTGRGYTESGGVRLALASAARAREHNRVSSALQRGQERR